jgi:uncharacterized membrane protein YozB (DUF420 family)
LLIFCNSRNLKYKKKKKRKKKKKSANHSAAFFSFLIFLHVFLGGLIIAVGSTPQDWAGTVKQITTIILITTIFNNANIIFPQILK